MNLMQITEYRANPDQCPKCRSHDIEGKSLEVDGNECQQKMYCNECEFRWFDIYQRDYFVPVEDTSDEIDEKRKEAILKAIEEKEMRKKAFLEHRQMQKRLAIEARLIEKGFKKAQEEKY